MIPIVHVFDEDDERHAEETEVRCKFCSERYLYWQDQGDGTVVLVNEDNELHDCPARKGSTDDFEEL